MTHFAPALLETLEQRGLTRPEFAAKLGLQPNQLSNILAGRAKVGYNVAAKIFDGLKPEELPGLLLAYLRDETAKISAARDKKHPALERMVAISSEGETETRKAKPEWETMPDATRRRLREYDRRAKTDPNMWHAVNSFLDAMMR